MFFCISNIKCTSSATHLVKLLLCRGGEDYFQGLCLILKEIIRIYICVWQDRCDALGQPVTQLIITHAYYWQTQLKLVKCCTYFEIFLQYIRISIGKGHFVGFEFVSDKFMHFKYAKRCSQSQMRSIMHRSPWKSSLKVRTRTFQTASTFARSRLSKVFLPHMRSTS